MSKFNLGRVTSSDGAVQFCRDNGLSMVLDIIFPHSLGEWGDVTDGHREANEDALRDGGQLVSIYTFPLGKVRVITTADRTSTYVLLEDEYMKLAN